MTDPTLESLIDSVCNVEGKAEKYIATAPEHGAFPHVVRRIDEESGNSMSSYALGRYRGFKAGASCVASPLRAALLEALDFIEIATPKPSLCTDKIRRILSQAAEGKVE